MVTRSVQYRTESGLAPVAAKDPTVHSMVRKMRDHLNILMRVFDEAWASIAPTINPASVENARESLADAIIAHASTLGTDDLAALKAAALASFREQLTLYPQRAAPRPHRLIY